MSLLQALDRPPRLLYLAGAAPRPSAAVAQFEAAIERNFGCLPDRNEPPLNEDK